MTRPSQRAHNELRQRTLQRHYTRHAEGSVLASFGDTRVLCTASVENKVPPFLRGKGKGWITAEYGIVAPRNQYPYRTSKRPVANNPDERSRFNA